MKINENLDLKDTKPTSNEFDKIGRRLNYPPFLREKKCLKFEIF